ncbi:hypothetical protein HNR60_002939 [Rhodopseudomonas rhenobacensis]|uniref:Uncharacterized protein n=1 Tax=Rhodopseudomonas rhenobacensis TaxID=87461 RepID=A0A7W7Z613_9BRAD|nr:hypothetical protein [Rhodopseudomonas rhenobacensis]
MNKLQYCVTAIAALASTSAFAADYMAAPYQPRYVRRAPPPMYYAAPMPRIPQAPPVVWVQAPPNYVRHLVPVQGCGGCGPGYASVGEWQQTLPPGPFDRYIDDYGY